MSGAIFTTTTDPFALPEARAVCDDCRAMGPPVECRLPKRKGDVDAFALSLARQVSGFFTEWAWRPRAGRRAGGQIEHLMCRKCAEKRYREIVREHAKSLADIGNAWRLVAIRATPEYQRRVADMAKLRAYLGIPEVNIGEVAGVSPVP